MFGPLLKTVVAYPGLRARLVFGRRGPGGFDLDEVRVPDTKLAQEARDLAHATFSPYLLGHSYRTWLFGLALARLDGVDVDEEMVFVASLLHDLGLQEPTPGRCFAVVSAERAEELARSHGAGDDRARRIGAEISGHVTPGGYEDLTSEGGFVGAGATCDLMGLRLADLSAHWVDDVLELHPRTGFVKPFCQAWRAECRAMPDGRAQWLARYALMTTLVRLAPLPR